MHLLSEMLRSEMLKITFNPFPVLTSDRLYLRKIRATDVDQVFALRSNAETMKYISRPVAKTKQDAMDHINLSNKNAEDDLSINWAIALKEDDKLIGMICLINIEPENYRVETGYILHPDSRGKGIINEALRTVIDYAFNTLRFHSMKALIAPENSASEKVLLKAGFVKEAHFKQNRCFNGEFLDSIIYSLLSK